MHFLKDKDRAVEANLIFEEHLPGVGSLWKIEQVVTLHGDELGVVDDIGRVGAFFEGVSSVVNYALQLVLELDLVFHELGYV